jgi:MFS family permease
LLLGVAFAIFNLVFNLYMSALGFSNAIIGIFNSLPALALLGVGLPFAALADRIGYRLFLLGSTGLALLGSIVLAAAGNRLIAVLAAGTFALGITVLEVLSSPLLAQVSRDAERVSLFAVNQSLSWVAALLGNLLGGQIPEAAGRAGHVSSGSAASIRASFIAMTILVAIAIPFLFRLLRLAGPQQAAVMPVKDMLRVDVPRFIRLLVPEFIIGIGAGMFLTFVQLYFAQRFGLTPGPIGEILGVGAGVTAIGTLAAPWLSRRIGLTRTVAFTQMSGFPLILLLAFLYSLPTATLVFYVRQILLNIQAPLATVFGMEYVVPEQRARVSTALTVVWGLGSGGIGPLASGFLQLAGGFQLAFSIAAVFYLLAGLSFLILFGTVRPPSEPGARSAGSSSSESITA